MNVSKHARALAVALAIGTAVIGLSAGPAEAKPKVDKNQVYCTVTKIDGTIEFYLPGEQLWDAIAGKAKTCGKDGKWHFEATPQSPAAPKPTGGVVEAN